MDSAVVHTCTEVISFLVSEYNITVSSVAVFSPFKDTSVILTGRCAFDPTIGLLLVLTSLKTHVRNQLALRLTYTDLDTGDKFIYPSWDIVVVN